MVGFAKTKTFGVLVAIAVLVAALVALVSSSAGAPGSQAAHAGAPRAQAGCARAGAATVRTAKARYAHYAVVRITGAGYGSNCQVLVRVTRPNGSVVVGNGSQRHGSDRVRTTAAGRLSYAYRLSAMDGRYRVQVLAPSGRTLAQTSFLDAFALVKLFLNSQTGPEDYQFTTGNTVWAQGSVDASDSTNPNRSYEFVFTTQSGTVKLTTPCTADGPLSTTVWGSYTIQPSDPVSTASDWHVQLKQFSDGACTTLEKTSTSLAFDVAKPTTYSSSNLSTKQSFFPAGATAYVTVAGLKAGQSGWSTTWTLPNGTSACANTAGSDRPASDANGLLPVGKNVYLQYAPGGKNASPWNIQTSYDSGSTCPAFGSANQGPWSLTLTLDATHFVALSPFSVDTTAPTSSAAAPPYTKSTAITIPYTASDDSNGSGLKSVALYAKAPGAASYSLATTLTSSATSGSFSYTATKGAGTYSFYAIATDNAGNVEPTPTTPDSTTVLDTTAPTSSASAPQTAATTNLTVSYTASDNSGGSGLATVDLYAKGPADTGYTKVATATSTATSGSFSYNAGEGDGSYSFYTIASDNAGNAQATPTTPNATTKVDTTPPTSSATSPQYSKSTSIAVSYAASDATGGSGLAKIDLYAKGPNDSSYAKTATIAGSAGSGSFTYSATEGEGTYSFYTIATDQYGNVQATPTAATTTTLLDTTAPTSTAQAPATSTSTQITVTYTASDTSGGSGLANVDLYAQGPKDASYVKVATASGSAASGSFTYLVNEGNGNYNFYTVASDQAGNAQPTPSSPQAITVVTAAPDTTAPTSSASSTPYTNSTNLTVSYTAADNSGGSGLAEVDLYAKGPSDGTYSQVGSVTGLAGSGSFKYTATEGAGAYSFYTIATDRAGNVQATPASPNTTTRLDTTAPTSHASSPTYFNSNSVTVSFTSSDDASGVAQVGLYAKGPADTGYVKVATSTAIDSTGSGSFTFTIGEGDGIYRFYTIATDGAGNTQQAPASPDTTSQLDTTAPASQASSPQYTTSGRFTVSYTAADEATGSGLARVDLYAEGPSDSGFSQVASIPGAAGSGSFNYTATEGEGPYHFYTIATDNAGNSEARPDATDPTTPGNTTTRYDTTPPVSQATSPGYANTPSFTVTYTASDTNSGLDHVDLYAQGPSDSSYSKVATDSAPGISGGSFSYNGTEGNGTYSFYTIATDHAGNVQAAPGTPDTTTKVDPNAGKTDVVDELHYTYTGPTSVAFDWRGSATDVRYGTTTSYGKVATAAPPSIQPISSPGPFEQVQLTNLLPGTTYHYSIGGGMDHTFSTAPTGNFRFDVEADIGSTRDYPNVGPTQSQIAGDNPAFVITDGDLSYAEPFGQPSVDQHFNDVMAWSTVAADMPSWGNHEWESPANDDLRNYKGRFMLPNAQTSSSAPAQGCCGQDWSWFDAGGVRFINYPEPYTSSTWTEWQQQADSIFAAAQADPSIHFIVTFGHRPAYSTGFHPGDTTLAAILNSFGDKYSKYVLNINGHSHDYERFVPIHGVTHITTGGGGGSLETPWSSTDSRTAFRAFHLEHLRVDVSSTGMRIDAICGPPTSADDITCVQGSVIDSYTIGANPPPAPPPPSTLYVDQSNPNCSDGGSGTQSQPFCSLKPATSRVVAGQTVLVGNGTYKEQLTPVSSGTAAKPIVFAAALGATPTITGVSNGIYISAVNYVTVQGFTVTGTSADAVVVKNASNITLRGNHISYAGQPVSGLIAKGIRADAMTNSLIADNTVDHNTDYGIYLFDGSTGNLVSGNDISDQARGYQRAASGIRLYGSTDNTISGNYSHDNEDSGLEFFNNAGGNVVIDNVSFNNGDHGIDDNNAPCQTIVSNSIYNNYTAGINLEGTTPGSPGAIVENNISVNNGFGTRTHGEIRIDGASNVPGTCVDGTPAPAPTVDYNLVNMVPPGTTYNCTPAGAASCSEITSNGATTLGTMYTWGNTPYSSLSAFRAATGQEAHGLQTDPLWVDPLNGDFDLQDSSPAIDSANSGAPGQPTTDYKGNPRVDDPYVTSTGAGPRNYDDRGAIELQPEPPPDQAPNAQATVTPNSGNGPLRVTVDASASTDTDATGIASYTFDFGDGSKPVTQSSPTATHTYTAIGLQTIKVTVTDTGGLASATSMQVLVRDAPPNSALTVTPSSGSAPLQVSADASASTQGSTPIATYKFDFGDGTAAVGPQAGPTATHTYTSTGTYIVTMTATDTAGGTSSASTQVTVSASPLGDSPPTAALSVAPSSGTAPLQVSADASASTDPDATPIASYTFNFGDGSASIGPQSSPTVSHTFAAAGTYTVTVTVTDTGGLSSTATKQVTVSPPHTPPAAKLSVTPSSGLTPMAVTADATGSADADGTPIASYKFSFGDGSTTAVVGPQSSPTAAHTYTVTATTTYTVTVTVTDALGTSSTASRQVTVYANKVGNPGFETGTTGWNTAGSSTGMAMALVGTGAHSGSNAVQLTNGNTTTGGTCMLNDSPNWVTSTSAGQYTGSLWVRADTAGQTLTLRFREYNNTSSSATLLGTATQPVKLTTSWQLVSVTVPVTSPGSTLDFNAYITNSAPGTCFYADDASIYNGSPLEAAPNASLTVTPTSGLAPLQVSADASSSSDTDSTPIASYTFDFGDGSTPVSQSSALATHTYTAPGTHTVKLTATDTAGNSSTTTTQVYVGDAPPSTALSVSPTSGNGPLQVTADASGSSDPDSTGLTSYTFDFGDGSKPVSQSTPTATHVYPNVGKYTVTVTATDSAGNASSTTKQVLVTDAPPTAGLNVNPTSGSAPLQVSADASTSTAGSTPIATYKFDFGDGSAAVGPQAAATASHTYTTAGTYTVTMTATDTAGSSSSATRQVTVSAATSQPPTSVLSVTPSSGTAPLDVSADASGSTAGSSPISTYKFDFGDGSTTAVVGPQASGTASHTYNAAGTYTVTVTVTDTAGKSSTATTQVTVSSTQPPTAMLAVTPSSGAAPLQVTADASASAAGSAQISSYMFSFGDGTSAIGPQTGATATHTYTTAGTYTVTMTVTDTAGNSSTATTQVTVSPAAATPPTAALSVVPTSGTAPLQVSADASGSTAGSSPIANYKFNFGDGSAAVGPQSAATATHTYTSAGTYTVTVTVTDTAGSSSTATQQVTVNAPDLPPAAAVSVTPTSGLAPLAVTADASASTDTDATPIASYKFNFGDGSSTAVVGPQAAASASHTYTTGGTYTVTVTVTDTVGNASTVTKQVTVYANLVGNPGFETGTTGWNTSGGGTGITLTQVAGGHSGSDAAQLTNTNTTNTTCLLNDSPNWVTKTGSGQYTGSLWVRADTAGASLNLRFREYSTAGTLLGTGTKSVTLSTSWQQVTTTLAVTSPGSTFDFNAYVTNAAPGTCFYADDATIYNG